MAPSGAFFIDLFSIFCIFDESIHNFMLELNKTYCCDCVEGMKQLDDNSVDLTVTSPPYDNLRTYQDDNFAWNFDIFKSVADELYRVTKPGGVVVWVVGDAVDNGSETGSSFRQALYFKEIGFKLHDTMIYEKNSSTFPAKITSKRYSQVFEYMFVLVKGKKIRDDIKLIADKRNKWAGWMNWGDRSQYTQEGTSMKSGDIKPIPEFSLRNNIWKYAVSFNDKTGHPAVFPEKLAEDHILSWSNEGDVVLDPFMGSGTTAKMAMLNKRNYIGFEKNHEYWEVSLKRVAKYEGKTKEEAETIDINDSFGNTDTLIIDSDTDKEVEEKTTMFNALVDQMNEYFNDMSVSILKTLKLSFASKANDKRVENAIKASGLTVGEETIEEPVKEVVESQPKSSIIADAILVNNGRIQEPKKEYVTPNVTVSEDTEKEHVALKLREEGIESQKIGNVTGIVLNGVEIFHTKAFEQAVNHEIRRMMQSGEFDEIVKELIASKEKIDVMPSMTVIDLSTMNPVELTPEPEKKKGRGRPKGSKDTKPRKLREKKTQEHNEQLDY